MSAKLTCCCNSSFWRCAFSAASGDDAKTGHAALVARDLLLASHSTLTEDEQRELELLMQSFALGPFGHAHSYLSDSWNRLDAAIVLIGWLPLLFRLTLRAPAICGLIVASAWHP